MGSETPDGSEDGPERVDLARNAFTAARGRAASTPQRRRGAGPSGGRRASPEARPSAAGSDDRDPQPLGSAVDRLASERGWETDLAVAGAMSRWGQIVGSEVAGHVAPERFEDQVLHVLADSTAWATQMTYLAPAIVRRLNQELGDGTVVRLQVHGPHGPSWRRGAFRVPGRGPRDTYG